MKFKYLFNFIYLISLLSSHKKWIFHYGVTKGMSFLVLVFLSLQTVVSYVQRPKNKHHFFVTMHIPLLYPQIRLCFTVLLFYFLLKLTLFTYNSLQDIKSCAYQISFSPIQVLQMVLLSLVYLFFFLPYCLNGHKYTVYRFRVSFFCSLCSRTFKFYFIHAWKSHFSFLLLYWSLPGVS